MKTFRFKYSVTVWILLTVISLVSLGGLVWNIFTIVEYAGISDKRVVSGAILCLLCLVLLSLSISIMVYGKYVIKNGCVYSYLGFIKSRFDVSELTELIHFKKSNKLVAYFGETNFIIVVIAPEFYEQFILAVREINPKISYNVKIDGEDTPD
ncbi:MAG: hypothetical protein IKB98_06960 [Clostridia bacterium]|nr:hypothetical protein [Clostridia bacterium]